MQSWLNASASKRNSVQLARSRKRKPVRNAKKPRRLKLNASKQNRQKRSARVEEKRIADEQAKREADVKHRKTVGTNIVNALTSNTSLTREQAIEVLTALKDDPSPARKFIIEATMNAYLTYDRIEDRRWAEQQLTDEKEKWIGDRAQKIIDMMPKEPSGLFHFTVPIDSSPYEGLRSDKAGEVYNDFISAVAYARAEYDWEHRTGCPF